ncbi:MAG: hypothetical protein GY841_22470 [FCB group bacterium]|nr:hypothetical protein [FCB group bacterium]
MMNKKMKMQRPMIEDVFEIEERLEKERLVQIMTKYKALKYRGCPIEILSRTALLGMLYEKEVPAIMRRYHALTQEQ